MALLHVQKFDCENVGRPVKFLRGKEKRRGLMLRAGPPLHHRGHARQFRRTQRAQDAENVQIGVRVVKIAARRRAVQNYRLEIVLRRFVQPFHQVFQCLMYVGHRVPQTLPATRSPAASAAASAETAKSFAAGIATRASTEAASASPTATHHRPDPPASTSTSSAARGSLPGSRNRDDNPDEREYRPEANGRRTGLLPVRPNWGRAR